MKNTMLLMALLFAMSSFSQIDDNWEDQSEKLQGYIITKKGDTINGYLKRYLKIKSQRKVKFFETLDSKPETFKPNDLLGYKIAADYYEVHPYEGMSGKTKVFLLKTVDGKIDLFEYYISVEDDQGKEMTLSKSGNTEISLDLDGSEIQTEVLALKDNKEYLKFASPKLLFSFKKVMSKYVADYPELSNKISKKEKGYSVINILKIVDEYNAHFED